MTTVLIGSCGGLVGTYLARHLSGLGYRCVGVDAEGPGASAKWLDGFHQNYPSTHKYFLDGVASSIDMFGADVYLPTHSEEINALVEENMRLAAAIALHPPAAMKLHDKRNLYKACAELGIDHCRHVHERYGYNLPAFAKPAAGSGSRGCFQCSSEGELGFAVDQDMLVLEFVEGPEVTCDALYVNGELHCMHARRRIKTLGGAAIVCETLESCAYTRMMKDDMAIIGREFGMHGPANAQFILHEDRGPVLIDFNLRFASGGLPCTVAAGLDIPHWTVLLALGEPPPPVPEIKPTRMVRYFEEMFTEAGAD